MIAVEGEDMSSVDDDAEFAEGRHDVGEQQSWPVSSTKKKKKGKLVDID